MLMFGQKGSVYSILRAGHFSIGRKYYSHPKFVFWYFESSANHCCRYFSQLTSPRTNHFFLSTGSFRDLDRLLTLRPPSLCSYVIPQHVWFTSSTTSWSSRVGGNVFRQDAQDLSSQIYNSVLRRQMAWWSTGVVIFIFGFTFALVPLYEVFCQETGYGGLTQRNEEPAPLPAPANSVVANRLIKVEFAGTVSHLPWEFKPSQRKLVVAPGETALAFYTAKNTADRPIIGMAVYHVQPPEAGIYFNKIQCFCFEEQMLNPGEEIDMPVLFFIDPDIVDDPRLDGVDDITLSYYFFEAQSAIPEEYNHLQIAKPTDRLAPVVSV